MLPLFFFLKSFILFRYLGSLKVKKIFVLLFVLSLFNDSNSFAKSKVKAKAKVSKNGTSTFIEFIYKKFNEGDYQQVLLDLDKIEIDIKKHKKHKKDIQGLVYYWKAVTYAKINEYEQSLAFFKNSIEENYIPKDLYYEYAQALYVSEKLKGARLAFKKSVKKKFKRGVSLYYIAYISQQLKDNKKAVKFYTMIEKLPEEEKKDVVQAARMQIGDIYLMQVEKMPNTFKSVRDYIIPQYRKAIEFDKQSTLAEEIRTKIRTL